MGSTKMPLQGWSAALLVATVAGACYLNTLRGGLVFDDHRGIETNDDIRADRSSLSQLFSNDFWGGSMAREQSHKSYRPLTVLSYRWFNYLTFGMAHWWFHAVNTILHALASALFWRVLREFGLAKQACLFGGLLFAVHSVHTEAVANTVGRAEVLSAIFFFAGTIVYARRVVACGGRPKEQQQPPTKDGDGGVHAWLWLGVAVLCAVLSLLSKEQGITVLTVYAAVDILTHWKRDNDGGKRLKAALIRVGVLAACAGVCLRLRLAMNHGTEPIFKPEEMRATFHADRRVRLLSFQYIYAWNALLLLWPAPLCCDWSLGSVPLVETMLDWRNCASLALYAMLLVYGLGALRQLLASPRAGWQPALGLALLVLPFAPSTGALFRVGFVVAERVLYIPSAGWCMIVAMGYQRLTTSPLLPSASRRVVCVLGAVTLLLMAAKTVHRNEDWNTDLQLYESGVRANPNNVKLHNNYGMMLVELGRHDDALRAYNAALELEPQYHDVHFNLGNLYHAAGQLDKAAAEFQFAAGNPNQARRSLNNLGSVLMKLNRLNDAELALRQAIKAPAPGNQDNSQAFNNLASVLGELKKYAEAEDAFREALRIRPDYVDAHFNYGTLLVHAGRMDEAERELREALRLHPGHAGAVNNLKVIEWRRAHPD
eukprot:scpid55659/ scgid35334/ Transmembrane and TPR repeat-containing protein 3